jgi:hypothetical protein
MRNDLDRFAAGNTMMNTDDLKSGRSLWVIVPTHLLPAPPSIVRICGHASPDAQSGKYGVFYGDSVQQAALR